MITVKEFDILNQPIGLFTHDSTVFLVGNIYKCKNGILWTVIDFNLGMIPFIINRNYGIPNFVIKKDILEFGSAQSKHIFRQLEEGEYDRELCDKWIAYLFKFSLDREGIAKIVHGVLRVGISDIQLTG